MMNEKLHDVALAVKEHKKTSLCPNWYVAHVQAKTGEEAAAKLVHTYENQEDAQLLSVKILEVMA